MAASPKAPTFARRGFCLSGGVSAPPRARQTDDDVAVALAGPAQRFEFRQDARIEPDMHAAILGALRLNSDGSERQRAAVAAIGGRRDRDADHAANVGSP